MESSLMCLAARSWKGAGEEVRSIGEKPRREGVGEKRREGGRR